MPCREAGAATCHCLRRTTYGGPTILYQNVILETFWIVDGATIWKKVIEIAASERTNVLRITFKGRIHGLALILIGLLIVAALACVKSARLVMNHVTCQSDSPNCVGD